MASNIDATIPVAGSLIQAGPLQLNFWTIKKEIEALQVAITTPCTCNVTVGSVAPFPATAGQLWFDSVGANLYVFDGCQWIVAVHTGDGIVVAPEWGVMDGSDARPGMVGEYIAISNLDGGGPSLAGLVMGPFQPLGSLTLTAGDWQVGGQIDAWLDVAGSAVVSNWGYFYLGPNDAIWPNTDVASDRAWALYRGDGGDAACFNMGPIRISSAAPTQIIFQGQVGASAAVPWGCDWVIWARRIR